MAEQNTAHGDPMPDYQEPHPFDGQFEQPAEVFAKSNPAVPLSDIALASLAISLKRMADAMSETNEYGEGPAKAIARALRGG